MSKPIDAAPAHLTDEQDRVLDGHLGTAAEKRSRANALYAEVMLLPTDDSSNAPQAIGLLKQVVQLDPGFTDAQVRLVNLLLEEGQFDAASDQLHDAVAANHDSLPLQAALAFTERLRGENDDASRLALRVLTADPTQTVAMRVLLEVASDDQDLAGGVVHIEDILSADGNKASASAWLDLARLYLETAHTETVPPPGEVMLRTRLPMLQRAVDLESPPTVDTLTDLSNTYRDLGELLESLDTMQRAVAITPKDVDLLLHCAALQTDLGRQDEAIESYEAAYKIDPTLAGLREMLGGLYLEVDRFAEAVPLFEAVQAASPQNPGLQVELGIAYQGAHQPEKAEACFQQVFDAGDCPADAYLKLAIFQLEHKEIKEAASTLTRAQAHFPKSARVCFYQAVQHRYEKNYDAALASLAQARTLATGAESGALDPDFYLESANILSLAGHKDQLEPTLLEALAKYPDNPDLMNELAYFWAEHSAHLPEALALSQRAAALEPANGPIQDTFGWVYFQMGQVKDALPYLQRAAFMTNNDPVVLQHIGDAYLKLGLRREAITTWTRALEKDPRNGDLASRIDAAQAQAKNAHLRSAPTP